MGLFVVGLFHCGGFIYCGLWGFLVCLWGFFNLIESCLLWGFPPDLPGGLIAFFSLGTDVTNTTNTDENLPVDSISISNIADRDERLFAW
jgi:hypothetical protein